MTAGYDLYGAEASSFTCKVKSYLRYKRIPFSEFPNSRAAYREVILPRIGYRVIPVLIAPDGEALQDSSDIIDALEVRFPQSSVFPEGPKQRLAALLLEFYGDEWLKLPAMHYRWTRDLDYATEEFGRMLAPELLGEERLAVGRKTAEYFICKLPDLGVTPKTEAAIESSLAAFLQELDRHFAIYEFLFGTRPSIGDFGLVGHLYANLYRDPYAGAITRASAPNVSLWIERMMRPPRPNGGEFLARDEIPETLLPILSRVTREMMPVLTSTAEHFVKWAANHPEGAAEIPESIGTHVYALEDSKENRAIFPYDLWMLQRSLDFLKSMTEDERRAAGELLSVIHGEALLDFPSFPRLTRRNYRLALA